MASRAVELPFITAAPGAKDCEPEAGLQIVVKIAIRNGVAVVMAGPFRYEVSGTDGGPLAVRQMPVANDAS